MPALHCEHSKMHVFIFYQHELVYCAFAYNYKMCYLKSRVVSHLQCLDQQNKYNHINQTNKNQNTSILAYSNFQVIFRP